MVSEFLQSLVIIFGVSAVTVFLLHRVKVPTIVGFLISGLIIGPYGIGMIKDAHFIELLVEVGVILLLFTIGMEFSIARLARMKKAVVGGGWNAASVHDRSISSCRISCNGKSQQVSFSRFPCSVKQHRHRPEDPRRKGTDHGGHLDFPGSLCHPLYAPHTCSVRGRDGFPLSEVLDKGLTYSWGQHFSLSAQPQGYE